ncbi:uncharacterized protein LOC105737436 isoform X2 [Apis florea]|uniref:uncharacterized protein LOC105737436 isoform X2 n=1 Tax=Apis florea TaxID=7463 RepID=UPI000629B3F4|nr:uncharacterized protein LOC105737436 isoform X2 [Apis florea]
MIRVYGDTGTEVNEMEGRENRGEKEAMEVKEHHAGHVSVCPMPVERDDYRFLALARSSQNLGHRASIDVSIYHHCSCYCYCCYRSQTIALSS